MGVERTDWQAAIASALDWWHDAGVTSLAADEARDWLTPPRPAAAPASEAPTPAPLADDRPPRDLAAFTAWRVGAAVPEAAWPGAPLFASGAASATLMVLVDCPDREDDAASRLLGGAAGRLFDRMLAAIGQTRENVLLAPVMTKRPYGAPATPVLDRLHALARHHLALAQPQRLLLLGNAASRAVLGVDATAARGSLHRVNHDGGTVAAVAGLHPRLLLERPAEKARAWHDLQLLMGAPRP